ncbi:MAG: hypothetical protein RBT49_16810 [Bacteroidales bacterium]|jgi:hypothetical protein|nr:hypothetical protein [Bacteroidales bacterium]
MIKIIIKSAFSIFIIFTTYLSNAQSKWDTLEKSTKSNTYTCTILSDNENVFINNKKFEKSLKDRKQYDNDINEYSSVKLKSHDIFLKAFTMTFATKRISQLAFNEESLLVSIIVDENAHIISANFSLNRNSSLSIEEIEKLEDELLKNVKFEIIGKKITEPIFYDWFSPVSFKEIEKGEIEFARKSENFKGF